MIGDCKRCQLPELYRKMVAAREATQITATNAMSAESPTEAAPYIEQAQVQKGEFEENRRKYAGFIELWRGTCPKCEFGA